MIKSGPSAIKTVLGHSSSAGGHAVHPHQPAATRILSNEQKPSQKETRKKY